jgi:hypothetical protein
MKTLLASIFVLALACPSFANQCPSLVKQIDEKLHRRICEGPPFLSADLRGSPAVEIG